jgi:tetratricopeptide (TPR) repeat protein
MVGTQTSPNVRWARAHGLFEAGEFDAAASILAEPASEIGDAAAGADALAVLLLLARAYYHSAQLHRAEAAARAVLASDPANAYAYLLLGRTLERQSRHAEAGGPLRMAAAMGVDR